MNIVIRTNCNGTLGHLARCRHLGTALSSLGCNTHYILDKSPKFSVAWFESLSWDTLYDDEASDFSSEGSDALLCAAVLSKHEPSLVIVDDYRLAEVWETKVRNLGYTLLAIDDLRRNHCVDFLLEPRYLQSIDHRQFPDFCMLLQGTRYTLLDSAYAQSPDTRKRGEFTVVLSLGGGGDLQVLHDCMCVLLRETHQPSLHLNNSGLILKPVIGPMATNVALIRNLAVQYPSQVFPVEQEDNLAVYFQKADLFVGAAGTSVYETAACDLPAITFSLAPNQFNELCDLELLGHYFHINDFQPDKSRSLATLIMTLKEQYSRLQALRNNPVAKIDGYGAQRVASIVRHQLAFKTPAKPGFVENRVGDNTDIVLTGNTDSSSMEPPLSFSIRACEDRDINRYLDARNLVANRENMTNNRPIHRLDHYHWWFTTRRQSYCAERHGIDALYIWHEVVISGNLDVLVGGWFVANEAIDIACVMSALQWQLALTDEELPHLPWIAVIKRSNQFVYKMNERAGFKQAKTGSVYHQAILEYFPEANSDDFYLVYRNCAAGTNVSV